MLDVGADWIEMDSQARHSQATSEAAILRNVECSMMNV